MLDTYDFEDDVWLCHSTGGECYDITAFVSMPFTFIRPQIFLAHTFENFGITWSIRTFIILF